MCAPFILFHCSFWVKTTGITGLVPAASRDTALQGRRGGGLEVQHVCHINFISLQLLGKNLLPSRGVVSRTTP